MKLVINKCFGGFSLSEAALRRLAELRGHEIYVEPNPRFRIFKDYWKVPADKRPAEIDWAAASTEERAAYNASMEDAMMKVRPEDRSEGALVQVVEELGDKASGDCAALKVVEIPDGVEYTIEEYDGREHVAESHRTWY